MKAILKIAFVAVAAILLFTGCGTFGAWLPPCSGGGAVITSFGEGGYNTSYWTN